MLQQLGSVPGSWLHKQTPVSELIGKSVQIVSPEQVHANKRFLYSRVVLIQFLVLYFD